MNFLTVLSAITVSCLAQRSPYAGRMPIGYPSYELSTAAPAQLGDRLGVSTTTTKLPLEALGNAELVTRISKLPVEHQPFWYLNSQALEENRKNPKTYQQKSNSFVDKVFLENNFNQNLPYEWKF